MRAILLRRNITFTLVAVVVAVATHLAFALSRSLPEPEIYFPQGYDTNRAEQVHSVLRSGKFKYLGGLVSYWEPEWSTILVYDGDGQALTAFLAALNGSVASLCASHFSPTFPRKPAAPSRQVVGG